MRTTIRRHAHLLAATLLLAMGALLVHAAVTQSPTIDEPNHLTRGMSYLSTGDSRMSYAHPPLANALQAIPGWLISDPIDFRKMGEDRAWIVESMARVYFRGDYEQARAALIAGRMVTVAITLLLGLYLYSFALRFGRLRAVLTLALFALHPLFFAHGSLVTTDMPVTAAMTVAVCEFVRWVQTGARLRFATFALATGVALSTKFSALGLIPSRGVPGLILAVGNKGPWAGRPLPRRLLVLGRDLLAVTAIAILVVNASYSFQRTGWTVERTLAAPEPKNWITAKHKGQLLEELSVLPSLPEWLPLPVPYTWTYGLYSIVAHNERGHVGWFLGAMEPSKLYFPLLSTIKTPAAILLLLLIGAGLGLWRMVAARRIRLPAASHLALWVVPILILISSLKAEIQIGVRHMLPIFPFVVMGAAHAATFLALKQPVVLAGLLALGAAELAGTAPRFIGHFSWAIGGPKVGHRISMVGEDWGQDVGELGRIAVAQGLEPLYYQPYGFASTRELLHFGAKFRSYSCKTKIEEPAWVAIHGANQVRWRRSKCGVIGRDAEPDFTIGEHIRVYRVEPKPDTAAPKHRKIEAPALAPNSLQLPKALPATANREGEEE